MEFLAGISCTNKNFLNIIDIIQSVEKDLKSHYVEKSQSSTEILCKIFCPFMTPLAASRYYTIIYQLVPLGMSNFRCQMEMIKYYRSLQCTGLLKPFHIIVSFHGIISGISTLMKARQSLRRHT